MNKVEVSNSRYLTKDYKKLKDFFLRDNYNMLKDNKLKIKHLQEEIVQT